MDCIVQPQSFWTGVVPHGLPSYPQRNYFPNVYFQRKPSFPSFYPGPSLFFPHDDDVDYPTDIKGELTSTMPYPGMADENGEVKLCVVCGERASGFYFGALVCLPCKSFYIRCTKEGEPAFTCQCSGNCDIVKQGRIRCQFCRYQRCLMAGMCRKEKPESVQPAEGQVLCKVCGDIANGIHFGVNTCEGCKKFFRRGLVENQSYVCKNEKDCGINPRNRNSCRYCRYQKCIAVGMSREAIKMGRPKKADGNEMTPSSAPDSPKMRRREVDLENNSEQSLTNPSESPRHMREDNNDTLNVNSVRNNIKQESEHSSCNMAKKSCEVWTHGNEAPWQPCNQVPAHSVAQSRQNVATNEFGEEDMDEILKLLQDDHQTGSLEHKKIHGFGYNLAKDCKTEYCEGSRGQWHVPDAIQTTQQGMTAMNMSAMSEPMNMTTGQMAQIPNRPPPQYPGLSSVDYQDQHSAPSPQCHSPRQMPSPSSYMSDSSAHSPGYVPNGCSPVHSPCQYSPSHSPSYQQSCPSPQNTSYHYDSSPQGSPMYQQNSYNSPNTYLDLSVNVNCNQSVMNPGSPSHTHSPIYNNLNMGQSGTSLNMTIPTQEGGVNSQDGWFMIGSPSQCCHSPSQTTAQQDRVSYKQRGATWNENLQRINNFFNNQCERSELHLNVEDDMDGTMTRNDVEREVVHKLLSSVSPSESYFYVMSDNHSSDSNSGSNYDEFTSCRRLNKRKSYDDSDMYESQSGAGFQIGKYKRQLTEKYWYMSATMEEAYPMTAEKQAILEHLSQAFQQMTERCTETAKRCNGQDARTWQQIQMRIVKNSSAFVKFALQVPGFSSIHPEDKSFLCQHVSFMSLLLMAGHNLYNPTEKNFRDFWNWNINQQNPFYGFKQRLLEVGQRIHDLKMDVYEISSLVALTILATDFTDLAYPEAIEDSRRKILAALRSYELSKGMNVKSRLGEMFSLVPAIRHIGMWHHELMRQMKLHIQPQEINQLVDNVQYGNY